MAMTAASPELGVTLQHYFPDRSVVNERWSVPEHWEMTGQMPFGRIVERPMEKTFREKSELVRFYDDPT